jgi:hypothetical protein
MYGKTLKLCLLRQQKAAQMIEQLFIQRALAVDNFSSIKVKHLPRHVG